MNNVIRVFIEASLTGNKFNGHYNYCVNLGKALARLPSKKFNYYFVLMNNNRVFTVEKPLYYISYRLYKFFYRFLFPAKIWHLTYQLTDLLPKHECKILLTIHDLNFLKEAIDESEIKNKLRELQENIDRADVISTISNYVKDDIRQYCELGNKRIHVIYNGGYIHEEERYKVNNLQKTINSKEFIFNVGVISWKKNIHILPYLLLGNELDLVFCGFLQDQDYLDEIYAIANNLGVRDRVKFLGPISEEDKLLMLRDCSLFAFPSKAEGFGLPVIEAMSFGKKVLLSKYTCLPEIGGPLAFYLENDTKDYLIEFASTKFKEILDSPIDHENVRKWAAQFTWERAAAEYEKLYLNLINEI